MLGERLVTFGDFRIALRSKISNGRRVFDQESEIVCLELRQNACHIGADGVSHTRVEAVIDVGEDEVELGVCLTDFFYLADPLFLYATGEASAENSKIA